MIICDTNIIIELYKNNSQIISELKQIGQENIVLSAITVAELYFGALNKTELKIIQKDVSPLTVISMNQEVTSTFITLIEKFSLSHRLSIPDAMIAAQAIVYDYPLFTLNKKDFKFISKLKLYA